MHCKLQLFRGYGADIVSACCNLSLYRTASTWASWGRSSVHQLLLGGVAGVEWEQEQALALEWELAVPARFGWVWSSHLLMVSISMFGTDINGITALGGK
jgi:hypothetical protein